jgi:hypothetical protein
MVILQLVFVKTVFIELVVKGNEIIINILNSSLIHSVITGLLFCKMSISNQIDHLDQILSFLEKTLYEHDNVIQKDEKHNKVCCIVS